MIRENRLVLNAADITNLLIAAKQLPEQADVSVVSGDASDADEDKLNIDDETPVVVFWKDEIELEGVELAPAAPAPAAKKPKA